MLFRTLPVRDIPANMQVTAKQIRYKGEDNLKNIFAVGRGSSDSGTGQENECTGGIVPETVDR